MQPILLTRLGGASWFWGRGTSYSSAKSPDSLASVEAPWINKMILIYTCKYDNHHEIDCEEIAHRNLLKCYSNVALNDHSTPTSTKKRSDNDSLSLKLIDSKTLILLVVLLVSSWMVVTSFLILGEQLIKKSLYWRCCSDRIFENKVFEFIKTPLLTHLSQYEKSLLCHMPTQCR